MPVLSLHWCLSRIICSTPSSNASSGVSWYESTTPETWSNRVCSASGGRGGRSNDPSSGVSFRGMSRSGDSSSGCSGGGRVSCHGAPVTNAGCRMVIYSTS